MLEALKIKQYLTPFIVQKFDTDDVHSAAKNEIIIPKTKKFRRLYGLSMEAFGYSCNEQMGDK